MTQTGKQIFLIGNWKSNKTLDESLKYVDEIKIPELLPQNHVVLCPPFPFLTSLHQSIKDHGLSIELGSQDVSPFPFGSYTGAVTASMLEGYCTYAIVGHSERRNYFHETNQDVGNKARMALDSGMTPIVCIDEPYLESQLAFFTDDELAKIIVAYEPVSAIGSGIPDTPDHAEEIAHKITTLARNDIPVLYGGSITADNVKRFIKMPHINGFLVGGASLTTKSWSALVQKALES